MARALLAAVMLGAAAQDTLGFGVAGPGSFFAPAGPLLRSAGEGVGAARGPLVAGRALLPAADGWAALAWRGRANSLSNVVMGSKMPRRRRGKGPQRSRWAARDVSDDPDAPQKEAEAAGDRMEKIDALVKRKHDGLIVVLEDPYDEGNAGAVIRSCDAFGVTEVWFVHNGLEEGTSMRSHVERDEEMDLDSTDMMKASSSATRWMVCKRVVGGTQNALDELRGMGYRQFATCFTDKSVSLYNTDLTPKKMALWVGNEFEGLSKLAIEGCDVELFIPMRGMIQSLNLSVASAVCLNEICRQRATSGKPEEYALPEETQRRMAGALSLKRRNYRRQRTEKVFERQEKTWESMVGKSNKPQKDSPRPDPWARGDPAVEVEST